MDGGYADDKLRDAMTETPDRRHGLCRHCATLDGGTYFRLARAMPPPSEGLGAYNRIRRRMDTNRGHPKISALYRKKNCSGILIQMG